MRCPVCKKPASETDKPFCGKRCKEVDLYRWFSGGYAVPAVESDEPEEKESGE